MLNSLGYLPALDFVTMVGRNFRRSRHLSEQFHRETGAYLGVVLARDPEAILEVRETSDEVVRLAVIAAKEARQ